MDYLSKYFPEYAASFPDTQEKRRAGMAAFRAKLLRSHQSTLAHMERTGLRPDGKRLNPVDVQFQRDMIASIRAAQIKYGEV